MSPWCVPVSLRCCLAASEVRWHAVFAGWFCQNGNGEMTGTTWVKESGFLYGPVMITNTHSVGVVRDAVIAVAVKSGSDLDETALVVAAGGRRDLGRLAERHQRLSRETGKPRLRGAGRRARRAGCRGQRRRRHRHDLLRFKGGIGTASRLVKDEAGNYTVGVLVQANFGRRRAAAGGWRTGGSRNSEEPA